MDDQEVIGMATLDEARSAKAALREKVAGLDGVIGVGVAPEFTTSLGQPPREHPTRAQAPPSSRVTAANGPTEGGSDKATVSVHGAAVRGATIAIPCAGAWDADSVPRET